MRLSFWPVRKQVIVNTKDGDAYKGILYSARGGLLTLKNWSSLTPDGEKPADGDFVIERFNVDFLQVL